MTETNYARDFAGREMHYVIHKRQRGTSKITGEHGATLYFTKQEAQDHVDRMKAHFAVGTAPHYDLTAVEYEVRTVVFPYLPDAIEPT